MKRGKNYKKALDTLSGKDSFGLSEAIKLLKESSSTKFDGTAELHINLNIDPKQADQQIRGTIMLPHGSGKILKIAAIVSEDKIKEAKSAGADAAGLDDLLADFEKGKIKYDIILATPDVMKNLGKVAKILGQKGLMPNPKSGTVVDDIAKAIKEFKGGKVEYRNDKDGNVHSIFGKSSFKEEELENNLKTILHKIRDSKPASIKGTFIQSMTICSSMGPGIKLDINKAIKAVSS